MFSISAVLPFLGVLTSPDRVFAHPAAQPMVKLLGFTTPSQLVLPLIITFAAAALMAGSLRVLLLWVTTRLSFAVGADFGISIYRRTLYQPYAVHVARNSSEVISGISGKANGVIYNIVLPVLTLIGSSMMLITILIALLAIEPVIALLAFGGFGGLYALIIFFTRRSLLVDSQSIARESIQVIKALQEGLGGIRDVLIDGSQATYCQVYKKADLQLRHAQGRSAFIAASPRYVMEVVGMLLITVLTYLLVQQTGGLGKAIPILGAIALGAQRLLPVLQQSYGSWTAIQSGQASLQDTLVLLDQPLPSHANLPILEALPFAKSISLKQLAFRYGPESPFVLKDLNFTINKGSRIGFIGVTGSGKSTLLDIVMALLEPTLGTMEVDGTPVWPNKNRAWQLHIAHVPQTIFLADSTIEENIAFGLPIDLIDRARVLKAAQQAQIAETIETWAKQYQTIIGERGIRLSGGQRQRIGIARALYKEADVIIFDEATSALDNQTEQAVMQAIEGLSQDLTLLIIAHRLTTLKGCTQIVELEDGSIKRIGTYEEIVKQSLVDKS